MAVNKNALIRYQALDRCFRNRHRRFYIDDLNEAVNNELSNHYGYAYEVKRRQIYNDIRYMESAQGWSIPLERVGDGRTCYYRYSKDFSINQLPLNDDEMNTLEQAVVTLSRFKGMPQFEWIESLMTKLQDKFHMKGNSDTVIGFEQNVDYVAASYLSDLFNAITNRQVLRLSYRTFAGKDLEWILHPYYLKQFNNRWFLFGRNHQYPDKLVNVALDRIVGFDVEPLEYVPCDIDFDEYFDDIIGVSHPVNGVEERVVLRFDAERLPYVLSKPPHGSMKIVDREKGIISLDLIPNKELESLIFSFGHQVEVLEPQLLRSEMQAKLEVLMKKYACTADRVHK